MTTFTVIKRDHEGQEVIRYSGELLQRAARKVVLEAYFGLEQVPVGELTFRQGDRFIETYHTARWYHIFQVHDQQSERPKCWYCEVAHPALIDGHQLSYRDLGLDLLVYPDGRQVVLDRDEFNALPLSDEQRTQAEAGLGELQALFRRKPPRI